jgi:hypothetical protein
MSDLMIKFLDTVYDCLVYLFYIVLLIVALPIYVVILCLLCIYWSGLSFSEGAKLLYKKIKNKLHG